MKKTMPIFVLCLVLWLLPVMGAAAVANPFGDVTEEDWFYDGVMGVYDREIMAGVSESAFHPAAAVTRAQTAQVLYNLEGRPVARGDGFDDVNEDMWYAQAVIWCAEEKLVSGYGDGDFGPEDPVTREQLVTILHRYAAYRRWDVSGTVDLDNYSDGDDVAPWAEDAFGWACDRGVVTGLDDGSLDPQGDTTRAQLAVIIMRLLAA